MVKKFSKCKFLIYRLSLRSGEKMRFPGWSTDLHIRPSMSTSSQQHSSRCTWWDKFSSTKPIQRNKTTDYTHRYRNIHTSRHGTNYSQRATPSHSALSSYSPFYPFHCVPTDSSCMFLCTHSTCQFLNPTVVLGPQSLPYHVLDFRCCIDIFGLNDIWIYSVT